MKPNSCSQKTGAKTGPRAPKLSYFNGRAPQLSARVHIYLNKNYILSITEIDFKVKATLLIELIQD